MDKEELQQMLSKNAGAREFDEWIRAFCNRKYNSDFSREMTRSVEGFSEGFPRLTAARRESPDTLQDGAEML